MLDGSEAKPPRAQRDDEQEIERRHESQPTPSTSTAVDAFTKEKLGNEMHAITCATLCPSHKTLASGATHRTAVLNQLVMASVTMCVASLLLYAGEVRLLRKRLRRHSSTTGARDEWEFPSAGTRRSSWRKEADAEVGIARPIRGYGPRHVTLFNPRCDAPLRTPPARSTVIPVAYR
jgi:hypothetical protein